MSYDASDYSDASDNVSSGSDIDSSSDADTELYDSGSSSDCTDNADTDLCGSDLLGSESAADTDLYDSEGPDNNADSNSESEAESDSETESYESDTETESEQKTESEDAETNAEKETEPEEDESEIRAEIDEKSDYSSEVNDHISSVEELEFYQKAGLKEESVDGRTCLVRDDLDYDYVDPKTGLTNRELMERGRPPYDAESGERIELHHIGQDPEAAFAELEEDSEHGDYTSVLHKSEEESWRKDNPQRNNYYNNVERPNHWIARSKGGK